MKKRLRKRNPIAKALSAKLFSQRIVKPKKGRGSYTRKGRKKTSL